MSGTTCPRLVEVDAAHNGELDTRARASLAGHQRDCACCQARADALAGLAARLAALPAPPTDALSARRQRNRLLAAFDAQRSAVPPPRRRRHLALAGAMAGAAALTAVFAVQRLAPRAAGPAPAADSAAAVTVVASRARWSRHDEGGLTLVRLEDGELELHVKHGAASHHLIVSLPDAELEDVGTTFTVRVEAGRTVWIAVRDGAVVLRSTGHPPVFLVAGDRWAAEPTPAPPPAAPSRAPTPPVAPPPSTPSRPPLSTAATEFRSAVAHLDAGRATEAAAALRAFATHHRDDPRAEDASYLLILALQRTGDRAAARTAAHDYLRRYPRGFRRTQVEAIVADAASSGP